VAVSMETVKRPCMPADPAGLATSTGAMCPFPRSLPPVVRFGPLGTVNKALLRLTIGRSANFIGPATAW
jgi:hypothetical protein